jgi:hypothetical protein
VANAGGRSRSGSTPRWRTEMNARGRWRTVRRGGFISRVSVVRFHPPPPSGSTRSGTGSRCCARAEQAAERSHYCSSTATSSSPGGRALTSRARRLSGARRARLPGLGSTVWCKQFVFSLSPPKRVHTCTPTPFACDSERLTCAHPWTQPLHSAHLGVPTSGGGKGSGRDLATTAGRGPNAGA